MVPYQPKTHTPRPRPRRCRAVYRLVVAFVVAAAGAHGAAAARQITFPDPPEPTREELIRSAGVDGQDPAALMARVREILTISPQAIDAWLPLKHEAEQRRMADELVRLIPPEGRKGPSREAVDRAVARLTEARLADPARHVDALLRQIGRVGQPVQVPELGDYARDNVPDVQQSDRLHARI